MYEEIIEEIKSNLGQNRDLNRKYLSSQIEKYKDHPYNKEIIKEISRMMWDCLSEDEKNEFIEISQKENPIMDILNDVSQFIETGDYNKALIMLDEFMESFPGMFEDDKVSEYHSFTNPLEEIIFRKYIGAKKEVRLIPDNQPLLDLYYIYGFLLFENKQYDKAEESLKKAKKINPVSARVILELSEIYKMHTPTFNKFFIYTTEALTYSYYPQDIARCYRNLGYYYVEENQLDVAVGLYKYSMEFEMSVMAYSELQYIESKGQNINLTTEESVEILKSKNIQIGVNPFILKTLGELASEYEENKLYNQSAYFYELIYNITKDGKIHEKIENITSKINLNNI
ncbi:MAG: tetratricopeptide repeat protein [Methanobrevibacter sp.]|uniref:tetratricopeptide repeat protein n=1 Tax=Methanobrevibacter sp. TaxID=66852 RepID=UPI0025F10A0A|nr:tetratricopeptide repeat protein [Methanobrevibacter sp.]MBQ6099213.1 tetratricopeptide repeat protein [Methanobrevibacter sp.]